MRERYTRIFEGTPDLYADGAPVIIKANVLLKDNTDGRVIAQLKYQNVSEKTVTFIKVVITPFDSMRSAIGQGETFEYLDLSAGQYKEFGSKNPLVLRERNARSYSVRVVGAAFADGGIWNDEGKEWRQDTEKAKDIDNDIVYLRAKSLLDTANSGLGYKKALDLFRAISGWKDADEQISTCQRKIEEIKAKGEEELKAREETDRIERERQAEQRRIEAEKAAKRGKIIFAIIMTVIVFSFAFLVIVSSSR